LTVGKKVTLADLDGTKTYIGRVSRINGKVDQASQTIKAFIEVKNKNLREGMYLEANLDAKEETDAIEINRGLLIEGDKIFVVRDSILDLINVRPVHFSDKKVVLKDVPDGTTIVSKPLMGAYMGMAVKIFEEKTANTKG
jgi:multidrug efflux pump subunit AcrA (membrane-fusion protein)